MSKPNTFARSLLLHMADGNCDLAKDFIRLGQISLARGHLRGALEQLDQAEQVSAERGTRNAEQQKAIEI